jgi:hypothetical protein
MVDFLPSHSGFSIHMIIAESAAMVHPKGRQAADAPCEFGLPNGGIMHQRMRRRALSTAGVCGAVV